MLCVSKFNVQFDIGPNVDPFDIVRTKIDEFWFDIDGVVGGDSIDGDDGAVEISDSLSLLFGGTRLDEDGDELVVDWWW